MRTKVRMTMMIKIRIQRCKSNPIAIYRSFLLLRKKINLIEDWKFLIEKWSLSHLLGLSLLLGIIQKKLLFQ